MDSESKVCMCVGVLGNIIKIIEWISYAHKDESWCLGRNMEYLIYTIVIYNYYNIE